jgi:hypothetical protein
MSALAERAVTPVGSLRRIHLGMIDAVLAGGGIAPVAALAAAKLGGTVAIVLPAEDVAVAEPALSEPRSAALGRYVADRLLARPVKVPAGLAAEVPVHSGDDLLGYVALLDAEPAADVHEILELAAVAALTAVTLRDASVTQRRACAELFDEIRGPRPPSGADTVARARRLGADLSRGASALSVRPRAGHSERVLAAIAQEFPGALAAARADRVEALLPVPPGGEPESAEASARRLARRLRAGTPAGLSPFEHDVEALGTALRVAELALELEAVELDDLLTGSWRLVLATDPHALQALVDSTVGPATDLLDTLRAYLAHGANMNATAVAVYAHRHTVASRLERVRTLTGHDPQTPLGQAQLALGLQALDVQRAAARIARNSGMLLV